MTNDLLGSNFRVFSVFFILLFFLPLSFARSAISKVSLAVFFKIHLTSLEFLKVEKSSVNSLLP